MYSEVQTMYIDGSPECAIILNNQKITWLFHIINIIKSINYNNTYNY